MNPVLSESALAGKRVLVTGASGSIGGATAAALGAAGATVIAHHRSDRGAAERAVAHLDPRRIQFVSGDLGSAEGARAVWRAAIALGRLDAVVINAAAIPTTPLLGTDAEWDAGWEEVLRVNVIGAGALMREAVRTFAGQGGGTIVTVSSWAAEQGSRILDVSGYAASKAAVRNLAQTLARHYARHGVRVHVVAPGVVEGGMGVAGLEPEAIRQVAEGLAMGRHVAVDEVAQVIAFLTSDAAASMTGGTVDINGASYLR